MSRVDARSDDVRRRGRRRSPARRRRAAPSLTRICDTARLRADLDAGLARRGRDRLRDGAGAAARQAPRAERAVDLAHVVVEQHVGGARRSHAEKRADDARRRHRRLEHVGLEPLVEKVDRAHRHELDLVVPVVVRQRAEAACRGTADPSSPRGSSEVGSGGVMLEDRLDEPRPSRPSPCRTRRTPRRRLSSAARSRGASSRDRSRARGSRRSASA